MIFTSLEIVQLWVLYTRYCSTILDYTVAVIKHFCKCHCKETEADKSGYLSTISQADWAAPEVKGSAMSWDTK